MEIHSLFSKKIIYFVLVAAGVIVVYLGVKYFAPSTIEQSTAVVPVRTEYSNVLPPNIPEIVAPSTTEKIEQSYLLDYIDQGIKQSTVVTLEKKTPLDIFKDYETALRSAGWVVVNAVEGQDLASLYIVKGSQEINITIKRSDDHKGSILSLSVLNK